MNVRITVTGGDYMGRSYEGPLADAPVTILVPEGIVSARTTTESTRVRSAIARTLETEQRMTMGSAQWHLTIDRLPETVTS